MADWLLDGIVAWLLSFTVDTLNQLWRLLADTVFTTPDVTAAPQVIAIARRALAIVDACFVLAIIAAGVTVLARDTLQARYGPAELAPRLVVAFIAAHFSQPICRHAIELANALTQAITGEPIASAATFTRLLQVISEAMTNPGNALLLVIIGMLIGVLTAMLLVTWLVRLVVLVVLVGIAPAALACHALPHTDGAARLWWRALLGCLGVVVLQALALHTTVSIFLDPAASLGLPQDRSGMFNLFIIACLLWVTVRIPGLVRRHVTRTGGRTIGGYFVRVVLVHQLTGAIGHRLTPARGTGRARPPRPAAPQRPPSGPTQPALAAASPPPPPPAAPAAPPAGRARAPRSPAVRPPGAIPPMRPTWQAAPGARPSGTGWPAPPPGVARTPGARQSGLGWPAPAHPQPPRRRRRPVRARIPADVEAPDRVLFGLTARQAAILSAAAAGGYLFWQAAGARAPLPVVAAVLVPLAAAAAVIALGRRDGLPLDAWLLAAFAHNRRPPLAVPGGARPVPSWASPAGARSDRRAPAELRLPAAGVGEDGAIDLGGSAAALVAATTVNVALRTPAEQAALIAGYGRWLNALTGPAQVVISAQRVDLSGHAARVAEAARSLPDAALADAAADYAAFLLELAEDRDPLWRAVSVVCTAAGNGAAAAEAAEAVRRAEQAAAALAALGSRTRVLDGPTVTAVLCSAVDPYQPGDASWPRAIPSAPVTAAGTIPSGILR